MITLWWVINWWSGLQGTLRYINWLLTELKVIISELLWLTLSIDFIPSTVDGNLRTTYSYLIYCMIPRMRYYGRTRSEVQLVIVWWFSEKDTGYRLQSQILLAWERISLALSSATLVTWLHHLSQALPKFMTFGLTKIGTIVSRKLAL